MLNNECGICHKRNDQHLLAKCDTCHLYYHLYCLNPPLTRLPKKSKLYGWQCSECDKTSDSEQDIIETKTPRRSRTRNSTSKDDTNNYSMISSSETQSHRNSRRLSQENNFATPIVKIKPLEQPTVIVSSSAVTNSNTITTTNKTQHNSNYSSTTYSTNSLPSSPSNTTASGYHHQNSNNTTINESPTTGSLAMDYQASSTLYLDNAQLSSKSAKKRRREKHRSRYSPDMLNPSREHKRKRKKKSLDIENPNVVHPRITIKVFNLKTFPLPENLKIYQVTKKILPFKISQMGPFLKNRFIPSKMCFNLFLSSKVGYV